MVSLSSLWIPILVSAVAGTTLKSVFDGVIYAIVTGQTFGWLWPQ